MHLPFNIPEPCNEDWSAMQPNGQGRQCMSCAKTVVDFTGWEVADIQRYLKQQTGAKVCGRFKTSQLAPEPEKPSELVIQEIWTSRLPEIKKMAAMICLFFSMFFTACNNEPAKSKAVVEQTQEVLLGDTVANAPQIAVQDTAPHKVIFKTHVTVDHGEIGILDPPSVTMGVPPMLPKPIQKPVKPKPKKPGNFIGPEPPEQEIMGGLPADVQELPTPVTEPGVDSVVKR